MIKKLLNWSLRWHRKSRPMDTLIWQSFSEPQHFLILLPKNWAWGVDTFHFLRVSMDATQIGIEMRFRHSQKLPWLNPSYGPTSFTLNPLAEAVVQPLEQYLKARSAGKTQAVEQFHSLIFQLYDRILDEVERLSTPALLLKTHQEQDSFDYSDLENMLDAFDRGNVG